MSPEHCNSLWPHAITTYVARQDVLGACSVSKGGAAVAAAAIMAGGTTVNSWGTAHMCMSAKAASNRLACISA